MRYFRPVLLLGLLTATLTTAAIGSNAPNGAAADELAVLAAHAEELGDFGGAAALLERARPQAAPEKWRELTLRLAALKIRMNQLVEADKLLSEMELLDPEADAVPRRIVQARLLAASGNFAAADELCRTLQLDGKLTRDQLFQVMNVAADAKLGARKYGEAVELFERMEKMAIGPDEEFDARCRLIYALQLAGRLADSAALMSDAAKRFKTPVMQKNLAKLDLMQMAVEKRSEDFLKKYPSVSAGLPADRPDYLMMQAARRAAANLTVNGKDAEYAQAEKLLRAAFDFADAAEDRKGILTELINAGIAAGKPLDAAAAIAKYLTFYPQDPGRVRLLMEAGKLLAAGRQPGEALKSFDRITAEFKLPVDVRLAAAREGAATARAAGMTAAEAGYLSYMVKNSVTAEQRQESYFLSGEAEFRKGQFAMAAETFAAAAAEAGPWQEKAYFWQLQSLIKAENFEAALKTAQSLQNAASPEIRIAAEYFLAMLLEKTGEPEKAMAAYLKLAGQHPGSAYAATAVFDAGQLAMRKLDYVRAAGLFTDFAEKYAKNELAPNALFKAVQAAFLIPDDKIMEQCVNRLTAEYPASNYTTAALFLQADMMCGAARFAPALAVLDKIVELVGDRSQETVARCRFDQAEIHFQLGNPDRAEELLNEILDKYVGTQVAADAARLAADNFSNSGEFRKAIDAYKRAAELRPGGRFADICFERAADSEMSAYAEQRDPKLLESAAAAYAKLAAANLPATIYSCTYKLGRCQELADHPKAALAAYSEVLHRAVAARRDGQEFDPVWVGKAAYAAVMIHLRNNRPDAGREALRIIEIFQSLQLDTGENFDRIVETIRARYKI